jgi:hypothetical protein
VAGCSLRLALGKSTRLFKKINLKKKKWLGVWVEWQSIYVASMRP